MVHLGRVARHAHCEAVARVAVAGRQHLHHHVALGHARAVKDVDDGVTGLVAVKGDALVLLQQLAKGAGQARQACRGEGR